MALRVFGVEDNPSMCEYLRVALTSDAEVRLVGMAETESQAKHGLTHSHGQWDLAVVDLGLKEAAAGVVDYCRQRREDQSLVVMTHHDVLPLRNRCKLQGADAVCIKSADQVDLLVYCIGMAVEGDGRMVLQ